VRQRTQTAVQVQVQQQLELLQLLVAAQEPLPLQQLGLLGVDDARARLARLGCLFRVRHGRVECIHDTLLVWLQGPGAVAALGGQAGRCCRSRSACQAVPKGGGAAHTRRLQVPELLETPAALTQGTQAALASCVECCVW
jgi:hypothetical protein